MSSFGDLEKRDGRTTMCPRCGTHPVGGRIQIVARRQIKNAGAQKQVASVNLAMCEFCCVKEFIRLEESLYQGIDPESKSAQEHARLKK